MRRGRFSIMSQPILIGALAILVLLLGIWISYNVTTGLPFVPKYKINVRVPNSAQMFKGGDVTIAGKRVGQVISIKPVPGGNGRSVAQLSVAIDKRYEPLSVDTTAVVRVGGTLGSKFLALTPGTSARTIPPDGVLPASQASPATVDIDQLFNIFRTPVRAGARRGLAGFGIGFAGRGGDLNAAIGAFRPLLRDLEPVMRTLAARDTRFGAFNRALERLAAELAPESARAARLFVDLDTTFGALAAVEPDIEQTIVESPPTMDAAISAFARDTPFLRQSTALLRESRPGFEALRGAAPPLAAALEAGARTLPRVPVLSGRLTTAAGRVADYAEEPDVLAGLDRIALTGTALDPFTSYVAPAQTQCSYIGLLVRNLNSALKERIGPTGTAARVSAVVVGVATNSERGPSTQIFSGPVSKALGPLHANAYPNTAAPGQPKECESGNEPYVTNQPLVGTIPGTQESTTEAVSLP